MRTAQVAAGVFNVLESDPLPAWWDRIPEEFRSRCAYKSVPRWSLSGEAEGLAVLYIDRFGKKTVNKRIPVLNWKRADICWHSVPKDLPLLDVGSGLGEFVNLFAINNKNAPVASVDKRDWDCWFDATGRIERTYADIFNLDDSMARDVVTCFEVIEHLSPERVPDAVNILRRLSRKKLYISVPFMEALPLYRGHFTRFTKENLLTLFPDAKFTIFGKNDNRDDQILAWILCEISVSSE